MTTPDTGDDQAADLQEARVEALQPVVDRVLSWPESAPDGTVREELDAALTEVGPELDDATCERIVEHIHEGAEHTDVRRFLSRGDGGRPEHTTQGWGLAPPLTP